MAHGNWTKNLFFRHFFLKRWYCRTGRSPAAGGGDSELIRLLIVKKSRFAFDSELVQKQNLFAFDYVQNNFHATTVYLSDDKSQLSSQSLGYARVIVCIQLNCIIIFFPDFFFFYLGLIWFSQRKSILIWIGIWFAKSTRICFWIDSDMIQYTKRK